MDHERMPFTSAAKAMKAIRIAPTFAASLRPAVVPLARESRKLAPIFSFGTGSESSMGSIFGMSNFPAAEGRSAAVNGDLLRSS